MPHPDFSALVDSLFPFAQSMLNKHGDFHPFGAVMAPDGAIQMIAAHTGDEFPPAQTLIDTMSELIKEKAASDEIRAAAICYDAFAMPPGETVKTDAVAFNLEHRSGESIGAFFPYVKGENGDCDFNREVFVVKRTVQFFSKSGDQQKP